MTIEVKKFKTPWRKNTGLWEDSHLHDDPNSLELRGTPGVIAEHIRSRLKAGRAVTVVDLGGAFAGDTIAIAANFQPEVRSKRLRVLVTNREAFDPENGITGSVEDRSARQPTLNTPTEFPSPELLRFIKQNRGNVEYIPGVDTLNLGKILGERGGNADVVIEHFGGVYHHGDKMAAVRAVADNLKDDGVFVTADGLLDRVPDVDIEAAGLIRVKSPTSEENQFHLIYRKKV